MLTLPPLSLYIHIPWCVRKCPYCDFNSHTASEIPESEYLAQLLRDLDEDLYFVQDRALQSIFIGGGTPSLMSGDFYKSLLESVEVRIPFHPDIEITLEANPGTFEATHFKEYHEAGVNRISLGVQSFNDEHLKSLGRIHSASNALAAVEQLDIVGFSNFNIDLMHGLPDQTCEQALEDLDQAMRLKPKHLSWYQLTIEQNTEFYRYPPSLPVDDVLWDIQEKGSQFLAENGFEQYEISAYSVAGYPSRHNMNYWKFGDYLGIGAGAHAKISIPDSGIIRYRKTRLPADYLKCISAFRRGEERIKPEELPFEFMMNALRLKQGVSPELFAERTGLALDLLEPTLSELRAQGLMQKDCLATTERGMLFLNEVLERFA